MSIRKSVLGVDPVLLRGVAETALTLIKKKMDLRMKVLCGTPGTPQPLHKIEGVSVEGVPMPAIYASPPDPLSTHEEQSILASVRHYAGEEGGLLGQISNIIPPDAMKKLMERLTDHVGDVLDGEDWKKGKRDDDEEGEEPPDIPG